MESSLSKNESNSCHVTTNTKYKKGSLPMKMRALPQSFWQQPNILAEVSPTYCPPLDNDIEQSSRCEVIGVANTELLFSLFHSVETSEGEEVKIPTIKRGRPRKLKSKSMNKGKKDVDPYFTSATVPCIQIEKCDKIAQEQQVLSMISTAGENCMPINNSYSEKLSNLVVNL